MVAKLFTKPFGVAGDKTPIPNGVQTDGTVSYESGFGADYERQLGVDPAAKNIGRQTFNELMFDATTALQENQAGFGASPYSLVLAQALPGGGYPKGALIPRADGTGLWFNTVVANTTNPDTGGAGWLQFNAQDSLYAVDTGVANTYVCAFTPTLVRSEAHPISVRIKTANTGASTINDGNGAVPIVGALLLGLQGGELVQNTVAILQWVAAISSYVVAFSAGALQVGPASKSLQAVNAQQVQRQSTTFFTTTGTSTTQAILPVPAVQAYAAGLRFSVVFNVASGASPTLDASGLGPKNVMQYTASGKVSATWGAGQVADVVYDGTDWVLLQQLSYAVQASTDSFTAGKVALVGSGGVGGATIVYAGSIDSLAAGQLFSTGPGSTTLPQYAATTQGQGVYIHLNANFGYMRWTEITTGISFERQKVSGTWQAWGECYGQVSCDLTGSVFAFLTNAAPAGMIKANGAAVSRTVYARLFAKIGTLYGAGDGSTTFNTPDLRGEFIRGFSDGRTSVDVGRVMGSSQIGSLISYDPTTVSPISTGLHSTASDANTRIDLGLDIPEASGLYPNADVISGSSTGTFSVTAAAGVARPRNVALLYCIKF
jgi:microcystin-dependent protein